MYALDVQKQAGLWQWVPKMIDICPSPQVSALLLGGLSVEGHHVVFLVRFKDTWLAVAGHLIDHNSVHQSAASSLIRGLTVQACCLAFQR